MTDRKGLTRGMQEGARDNGLESGEMEKAAWGSLISGLETLEDESPPQGLTDRIMASLQPKKQTWWLRAWNWLYMPKTITFSPLRMASLMGALVVVLALVVAQGHYGSDSKVLVGANNSDLVPIVFTLDRAGAGSVNVIGSFNYWNPDGYQMRWDEKSGVWYLKVALPAGTYEYSFLIDGRTPVTDPKAVFTKADGFGNNNAVVYVEKGPSI